MAGTRAPDEGVSDVPFHVQRRLVLNAASTAGGGRTYRAPRGTRDLLPAELPRWRQLEALARGLSMRYGYPPIETPLFEESDVFERSIGAATDVVEKELFRVRSGVEKDRWALRPEATAGIVRAYLQHGMQTWPQPVRLSLWGAMFRYDRPQAGRYRQFWQWDVEAIGDAGPAIDAEIVELGHRFYRDAGLSGVVAQLNSIGDPVCRPGYIAVLVEHFQAHATQLPELERRRLEQNPLRLLDSKAPAMAPLIAAAPRMVDRLCDPCRTHFERLQEHLARVNVPISLDPALVRGLDYYTRTAFEYRVPGADGSQQALGGGGRYDGLVELLGGRPTPGIGFALGLDRVVLMLQEQGAAAAATESPVAVVVGADPADTVARLELATRLRGEGLAVRADLGERKLGRQLEGAARDGAHFAVILPEETGGRQVQLKDLEAGTQRAVNIPDLARELLRAHASHRHGPPDD